MDDVEPGGGNGKEGAVFTDTVSIRVGEAWSAGLPHVGGVQLCPALLLGSAHALPNAVKHIYSRLAATASEVDQGIPDVLLSLVSTGNILSTQYREEIEHSLAPLVGQCDVWLLSSGEADDPLSSVAASLLRNVLPKCEHNIEVLHIAVSSLEVLAWAPPTVDVGSMANEAGDTITPVTVATVSQPKIMVDSSLNTLFVVTKKAGLSREMLAHFRALTALRLANPPPALLIGVPDANSPSSGISLGTDSAPVLLSPSIERRPLSVMLFAGADATALSELCTYIESGVPTLVLQDSSELCAILHDAVEGCRRPNFNRTTWTEWLEGQIRAVMDTDEDYGDEDVISRSVRLITRIAAAVTAEGSAAFLSFVNSNERLSEKIAELCLRAARDDTDIRRSLIVSAKLDISSLLNAVSLEHFADDTFLQELYVECLRGSRVSFLSAMLDRNLPLPTTNQFLISVLHAISDQYFFNAVILGQCLGRSSSPAVIDERLSRDLTRLLYRHYSVFSRVASMVFSLLRHKDLKKWHFEVWTLLLLQPSATQCLVAHSTDPLPLAVVFTRVTKSLSHEAHEWFFYEERLRSMADSLSNFTLKLLDSVHSRSQAKSYQLLCQPLEAFNGVPLTELAFQTHNRRFIAHECCQLWVHRLLYGHLQVRTGNSWLPWLPVWARLLISALLIVPSKWLVVVRPSTAFKAYAGPSHSISSASSGGAGGFRNRIHSNNDISARPASPTVALLESGRQPKRIRAVSTYSVVSGRSSHEALSTLTAVGNFTTAGGGGDEASTPLSLYHADDPDVTDFRQSAHSLRNPPHRSKSKPPSLSTFYGTPIVKYWLSLAFRLLLLVLLGYSVTLPGCGSPSLDTALWAWMLLAWIESVWSLVAKIASVTSATATQHNKSSSISSLKAWRRSYRTSSVLRENHWHFFDVTVFGLLLVLYFVFKIAVHGLIATEVIPFVHSVYAGRVVGATLLLYLCYSTLFTYAPLSKIFGPLLVRVKLMVLRDFINFLILAALVMASSAIAVHSVLYPDRPATVTSVLRSLEWSFLGLFTTDLAALEETEECRKGQLGPRRDFCQAVAGYKNHSCPVQGAAGWIFLIEYFIVLKLILWPLLFALFARTAKAVDEEADAIWRFQLYALVQDFNSRPFLPPPLSPLLLICAAGGRAHGCFSTLLPRFGGNAVDHPDLVTDDLPRCSARGIYRSPSVPHRRFEFAKAFWRAQAIALWRETFGAFQGKRQDCEELKHVRQQLKHLQLAGEFRKSQGSKKFAELPYPEGSKDSDTKRRRKKLAVDKEDQPWSVPLSGYSPPFYSRSALEFSEPLQRHVDHATAHNVSELRRQWRARQWFEQVTQPLHSANFEPKFPVSVAGFPLNPNGRQGLAGRGNHAKFGPNQRVVYIILTGVKEHELRLLVDKTGRLPYEWRFETPSSSCRDPVLSAILRQVGVADADPIHTWPRPLAVGASEAGHAHVAAHLLPSPEDTDNAWTERDVWAVHLGTRKVLPQTVGYNWIPLRGGRFSHEEEDFIIRAIQVLEILGRSK